MYPAFVEHKLRALDGMRCALVLLSNAASEGIFRFTEKHGMVVWRFHGHWHMRKPDGIESGMVRLLGWEKFQKPENQNLFVMPETTVKKLAEELANKLASPVVRVVGNPEMKVTKVGFSPLLLSALLSAKLPVGSRYSANTE